VQDDFAATRNPAWSEEVTHASASLPDAKELLLKELDHIQAILARYDTFFFLMKQLCATAVFACILGHAASSPKASRQLAQARAATFNCDSYSHLLFIADYCFRWLYWSGYITRLNSVRNAIDHSTTPGRIYVIKEGTNAVASVKLFDIWVLHYNRSNHLGYPPMATNPVKPARSRMSFGCFLGVKFPLKARHPKLA
jgi:hypothetical protein